MPSILVADDNRNVRDLITGFFKQRADLCITEAVDGLDAIEKARNLRPDLIILDLSMPGMSGLDAARVLRPMMDKRPIILFTAYASVVSPSTLAAAGINALFSKAEIAELVEHVERLLQSV